jgi:hypothetical protein
MRKLVIVLVVLIALGVVADRAAAYVAEGVVAQKIQDAEGVEDASVDITGFPFLTQVLAGEFSAIEVSMPTVDASTGGGGSVRVDELDVTFRGVVTSDGFKAATADSITGSGSIPYDEFTGLGLVDVRYGGPTPGGDGAVVLSMGRSLTARVVPTMLDGQTLGFTGAGGNTQVDGLPDALATFALESYALSGLPSGFTIEAVEATPDGLELTVSGADVPLA